MQGNSAAMRRGAEQWHGKGGGPELSGWPKTEEPPRPVETGTAGPHDAAARSKFGRIFKSEQRGAAT